MVLSLVALVTAGCSSTEATTPSTTGVQDQAKQHRAAITGGGPRQAALLQAIAQRTSGPGGLVLRLQRPASDQLATTDGDVAIAALIRAADPAGAALRAWYAALIAGAFNDLTPPDRPLVAFDVQYQIGSRSPEHGGRHPIWGPSPYSRETRPSSLEALSLLGKNVRAMGGRILSTRSTRPLGTALAVKVGVDADRFLAKEATGLAGLQAGLVDEHRPLLDGLFLEVRDLSDGRLLVANGYATRLGMAFGWRGEA